MSVEVNYIAVVVAVIISMGIGFAWYSPMLFGKAWMREMGHKKQDMKSDAMGKMYALSTIGTILMAFVLSHVMYLSESFYMSGFIMTGVMSAFWVWVGFVMPVQMTEVLFGGRSWKGFGINTGYQLVSLLVMGVVIGAFGV